MLWDLLVPWYSISLTSYMCLTFQLWKTVFMILNFSSMRLHLWLYFWVLLPVFTTVYTHSHFDLFHDTTEYYFNFFETIFVGSFLSSVWLFLCLYIRVQKQHCEISAPFFPLLQPFHQHFLFNKNISSSWLFTVTR